jgi:hypothetical protein
MAEKTKRRRGIRVYPKARNCSQEQKDSNNIGTPHSKENLATKSMDLISTEIHFIFLKLSKGIWITQ